jgi:hypothetical protein
MEVDELGVICHPKTLVIACNVLKEQIESIGVKRYDYLYLEQGLHRLPGHLKKELECEISKASTYDRILLGYGLCSRAVIGLMAGRNQTLIIPRIDDCIGLSLGFRSKYYTEFAQNPGTYYFTKGWVEAAEDPLKEYYKTLEKYDEETAEWVAHESLKHYRRTVLIRTQENEESAQQYVMEFARFFNLRYEEITGSKDYIRKLLLGPWDEDFVQIENESIIEDHLFS